jgi:oligopeptide/dipeptide ABC transporter ATP-binding protein
LLLATARAVFEVDWREKSVSPGFNFCAHNLECEERVIGVSNANTENHRGPSPVIAYDERPILSVKNLRVQLSTRQGIGKAIDGVSFDLWPGETLGLVGESGSGKSLTSLTLLGLQPKPAAEVVEGEILFRGEDLLKKTPRELRSYRGRHIAMALQDPMSALNPVFTIGRQLFEPLRLHKKLSGEALRARAVELLQLLQIPSPEDRLVSFPHQLSGGMRQRAVGAIALSCDPEVLIADEPTTALDVTVQAHYLALLNDIQKVTGLAILFITHDFAVVTKMCDRVCVMYAGRIVETASARDLFENPKHPYTEALLKSVPDVYKPVDRLPSIQGSPPSIYDRPNGCPFAPRCTYAMPRCREEYPPEISISETHKTSCWRHV